MAEPKENVLMEKIVSLCKRRGFIFQSSEIYGGINGFWDYGPLGAELKRNVKELWWNTMTRQRDDVVGLEATIIMHPQIWKASGHVDTFADLMVECPITKKRFRADQVEPQSGVAYFYSGAVDGVAVKTLSEQSLREGIPYTIAEEVPDEFIREFLRDFFQNIDVVSERLHADDAATKILLDALPKALRKGSFIDAPFSVLIPLNKNSGHAHKLARDYYRQRFGLTEPILLNRTQRKPETLENTTRYNPENGALLTDPRPFNLMFRTYVGPVESADNLAYLRPETAQAIFAQFKNVLTTAFGQKIPFGIAQVGKAFRNEVTPRNFTFRSREFEQMELEFFIKPDEAVEAVSGRVAKAEEVISINFQPPTANSQPPVAAPDTSHVAPDTSSWGWQAWHKYWVEERIRFYEGIGLPRATLEEYWQQPEELAHYARATVDLLFKFPFGTQELEGIAARSDFDLSQHERFSGKPMGVFDEELRSAWGRLDPAKQAALSKGYYEARLKYLTRTGLEPAAAEKEAKEDADGLARGQYIPHVIEPSAGVDRLILALICHAYHEDEMPDDKGRMERRVVMKFHPRVAPIKVGVLPLLKNKPELVNKALAVRDLLRPHLNVFYDDAGAIGKRYRKQDEAGTPFCVTIDFDTLGEKPELKDTVTVRYRDDGRQDRLPIGELLNWLLARIR